MDNGLPIISVDIAPDRKRAWLNNQEGVEIALETIEKELKAAGVVKGIIQENLAKAATGIKLRRSDPIAQMIPPTKGDDAKIVYLITHDVKPKLREDGTLDFREINLIKNVRENEPLLKKIPAKVGAPGYLVTGEEIPGKKGKDVSLKRFAGEGTKVSEKNPNIVIATRTGVFKRYSSGEVRVLDLYKVDGNIDYSTGNIHCTSSVEISGDVKSGFSIESGGDVVIKGLIENASINVDGNLNVGLGITKGFAPIIVEGVLNAMYIYNRPAIRAGEVNIGEMISNSNIRVNGNLTAKRIVGGEIIAKGDIVVEDLGADNQMVKTRISAGVDLQKIQRREKLIKTREDKNRLLKEYNKKLEELEYWAISFEQHSKKRIDEINRLSESTFGAKIKENIQLKLVQLTELRKQIREIKEFIASANREIKSLTEELANPPATITVNGTVFAGVSIIIGESAPMEINENLKKVVFKLDKDRNLVFNSLK